MARSTRNGSARPKKSGPPFLPIMGLFLLMVGAVYVARLAAQKKTEVEPPKEVQASEIFSGLPIEQPKMRKLGSGSTSDEGGNYEPAPEGLADSLEWKRAQGIAEEAFSVLDLAIKAKSTDNHSEWNEKGKRAKELFDEAITITASWEDELLESYGSKDRQVIAIQKERTKWFDKLRILHKTTSR
ncbi:MAG: hypothetical protein ACI8X5_003443 [Planctomycetota bacterium]|jgi:hypothetical protein